MGIFEIFLFFVLIPFGIAGVVCLAKKRKMNNVTSATRAQQYVVGSMVFTKRTDTFTHKTETREKIEEPAKNS